MWPSCWFCSDSVSLLTFSSQSNQFVVCCGRFNCSAEFSSAVTDGRWRLCGNTEKKFSWRVQWPTSCNNSCFVFYNILHFYTIWCNLQLMNCNLVMYFSSSYGIGMMNLLVHSQVTIIFVVSVCLSVCLFVCAEFFSAVFDPIYIKLGHMLHVRV